MAMAQPIRVENQVREPTWNCPKDTYEDWVNTATDWIAGTATPHLQTRQLSGKRVLALLCTSIITL